MSLDLYTEESQQAVKELRPIERPDPGAFDGFIRGTGMYTMRGFASAARAIDLAGAPLSIAEDKIFGSGTEAQDRFFRWHDEVLGSAVDAWTPTPGEVGVAAEVVGSLLSTLPLVIAAPGAAVASAQLGAAEDLVRKGVDSGKAQAVGAIQGAGLGLGIWMPILGQNLWQRVAIGGAGFNVLQGVAMRGASGAVLAGTPAAEDYQAFDGKALTLDVLLGLAFGSVAHLSPAQRTQGKAVYERMMNWLGEVDPSSVDAIVALRQSQHLNLDSAPGRLDAPVDVEAHTNRVRTAIEQLAKDEAVSVDDLPAAKFEPDARREQAAQRQVADLGKVADRVRQEDGIAPIEEAHPVSHYLSPDQQAIERRFWTQLEDFPTATKAYAKLKDSDGGKILNTDIARELSPDYNASNQTRSLNALAVHEPASDLVKKMYAERLKLPSESGENLVTFTAGGTGAGKTGAISGVPLAFEISKVSDIVYDTNMNSFGSAVTKIDQALEAGKRVAILYVGRDPVDALVGGALPRAMQKGRTVPLNEHAKTHIGAAEVMPKLMEHYADKKTQVQFVFIDNMHGKGNAQIGSPDLVRSYNFKDLDVRLKEALDAEKEAGRISADVYKGFSRDTALGAGEEAGGQRGQKPEPQRKDEPLQVFRVGEGSGLARRNAGDLEGIATYLRRLDDFESPTSSGASKISLYETPPVGEFGDYVSYRKTGAELPFDLEQKVTRGEIDRAAAEKTLGADKVGRGKMPHGGTQYSFPEGTEAKPLAQVAIEEVRQVLKAQTGFDRFDDASNAQVTAAVKTAFVNQVDLMKAEAPAALRGGEPTSSSSRSAAGGEATGAKAQDPHLAEAQRIADERPDIRLPMGVDEEGQTIFRTAREFLDDAMAQAAKLREESKLISVAADCMAGV